MLHSGSNTWQCMSSRQQRCNFSRFLLGLTPYPNVYHSVLHSGSSNSSNTRHRCNFLWLWHPIITRTAVHCISAQARSSACHRRDNAATSSDPTDSNTLCIIIRTAVHCNFCRSRWFWHPMYYHMYCCALQLVQIPLILTPTYVLSYVLLCTAQWLQLAAVHFIKAINNLLLSVLAAV